jgi:hypothetical protein
VDWAPLTLEAENRVLTTETQNDRRSGSLGGHSVFAVDMGLT